MVSTKVKRIVPYHNEGLSPSGTPITQLPDKRKKLESFSLVFL